TLTAAAYNFGNGNISNAIRRMGGDYFNMALNEETALYVYKIIAVKELLERPDLYIGNLGTNIFAYAAATPPTPGKNSKTPPPPATPIYTVSQPVTAATSLNNEEQEFTSLTVHTDEEDKPSIVPPAQIKPARYQYYKISLADNYNQFTDGMLVEIILHENFSFIGGGYTKNSKLTAKCYQYEDRAMLYLGDPAMSIVSPDADGALTLGIPIKDLRKRSAIMLKVEQ
ncbi:MAG TPA: hypothetical protein PKD90_12660, partial [Phnomibacter sp.]|nr:hypothetical protein [Phnomibacter sp.]